MTQPTIARHYLSATPHRLYGLLPVLEMVAIYCEARWFGVAGASAADVVAGVSAVMLEEAEADLMQALRTGSIRAWAVPREDGHTLALNPQLWSTSDANRHLLAGATDPARWSIPDAAETHWIVVEAAGLEETIAELFPGDDDMRAGRFGPGNMPRPTLPEAENRQVQDALAATGLASATSESPTQSDLQRDAPAMTEAAKIAVETPHEIREPQAARPAPRRFIGIKDVTARCGISRTRIYEKMKDDTFPKQVRLGEQTSRWYEDEIDDWIAAPR